VVYPENSLGQPWAATATDGEKQNC